jgi:hypothetical protein
MCCGVVPAVIDDGGRSGGGGDGSWFVMHALHHLEKELNLTHEKEN